MKIQTSQGHYNKEDDYQNGKEEMRSEWTEFAGYDEEGRPVFVTVKGIPKAN